MAPPRTVARLLVAGLAASTLASCAGGTGGRTEITFFQFKPEAVDYFEQRAAEFEAENPDIDVIVDNVPDPETALRTRLVKNDVPDVLTLNGNATFGELASAGIFANFAGDPLLEDLNEGYVEILQDLGASEDDAVNGIPFAANASGVLYNVELFEQQGVEVPQTWDELIAAAQTFEAAGITPFYAMLQDAWTAQAPLAPLTAQTVPEGFFEARFAGEATFAEGWREAAEKELELFEYTQPNPAGFGYQEGTVAFAAGESAMLLLGSYAVPQIRSFEPDFTVGSFALPATNDPTETRLVSGVDVLVTAGAAGAHPEESRRFIEFLMQPEAVQDYAEQQVAIPALEGATNPDPALAGIQPYILEERLVGFDDHQFIPAIPLGPLLQQLLIDEDPDAFLDGLDDSWDRVAQRRTWGLGAVSS
ncbi:ABC transporter substrate-binding protein [Cellulomonas cellasea]|uniref:Raffinose/stachyose/melibiose transport system substrate-binding protein n=1 Tax=Cellulomonas cellasea TaxID=43670 RepID=A0A7W4UJI4_9CELL|nr:extracellular solute-binding protein [Cellulomonas cellasea]MBB2924845.1 raffinose/stachyose/melibiose transport system substrate-binding protein [Cellulomonas cellasea]